MTYDVIDKVYSIIIDTMTGVCSGNGKATFYNTDSNTSFLEITVTNGGYGCVKDLVINGGTVHSSACYTTSDGIIMLGNSNSATGVPTDSFSNIVFNNIYLDFSNDETIGIANYRGNSCTFNNIRATDDIMNGTITGKTIYWEFNSTPEVGTNNRLYFAKPVCRNRLNITVYGKMPQTKVFGTVINAEGTVLGDVYFISSKDGTSKYIKYDAM